MIAIVMYGVILLMNVASIAVMYVAAIYVAVFAFALRVALQNVAIPFTWIASTRQSTAARLALLIGKQAGPLNGVTRAL
ncbi:hypothetical protein F2P44_05065 [Massilia sp. CCM 8695]|uniref:Uncharacterized protein n=1 Tax=Massilia frigida TaxID=2609281 RepID=A0ABX0N5X4_9BURK|nr:hypothetical protein [Massilia frigida]NHZ78656.1 hypothetical protein [Massilia frigida]